MKEKIVLEDYFDAKKLLFGEKLINQNVFWRYGNTMLEVHDRNGLKTLQTSCLNNRDYLGVKLINEILLELNFYEKRIELDSFPVNLQIEHTDYCNARCIMCSHCFTKNHGAVHLSQENLSYLDDILPYLRRITLHGYGEPFAHPQIMDILSKYHEHKIEMTCNTNGSIMNAELADLIHKSFYDISVSCDGATDYTYENIRKGLSFKRFKQNIRLLRSRGDQLFMRMAVVVMRQNLCEIPQIVELAAELGFQEVLFVDITSQMLLENNIDCLTNYPATTSYYISQAIEKAEQLKIDLKYPEYLLVEYDSAALADEQKAIHSVPFYRDDSFAENLYQRYKRSGFMELTMPATKENFVIPGNYSCEGICDFVLERPYINSKGDVFLCCTNWMHIIGNVYRDGGFEAVWNGEIMKRIRSIFYEGVLPKYCTGCIFVRNDMMCQRLKLKNLTKDFYKHNYDEMVSQMLADIE